MKIIKMKILGFSTSLNSNFGVSLQFDASDSFWCVTGRALAWRFVVAWHDGKAREARHVARRRAHIRSAILGDVRDGGHRDEAQRERAERDEPKGRGALSTPATRRNRQQQRALARSWRHVETWTVECW